MAAATALDPDLAALAEVRRTVRDAKAAWDALDGAEQQDLDAIVAAMAAAGTAAAADLARLAADETGYGVYEDKIVKNRYNTEFVARWMLGLQAVGVLWVDETQRVTAVGCPMGVIAALIPVTNPTSTVLFKSLAAVKSGNGVVHSPHPRAARCSTAAAQVMAEAAVEAGAPRGLIGWLSQPSLQATHELMRHDGVALVLATGGAGMVRAAYSSGKPTIAVGPGNVPAYVDRSAADPAEAAAMIIASKAFDNGTACVAEQSVVLHRDVAERVEDALSAQGAFWLDPGQQAALARTVFDDRLGLRPEAVGKSASVLADMAGFAVPPDTRVLTAMVEDVGRQTPLSLEILGPVLSVYRAADVEEAWGRCREVLAHGGEGHTVVVHAQDAEVVARFGTLPAGRILVNTPALFGGMGFTAAVDPSFQLGTGTWSGSICSDNVTPLHLINIKRVAHEIRPWRSVFNPSFA